MGNFRGWGMDHHPALGTLAIWWLQAPDAAEASAALCGSSRPDKGLVDDDKSTQSPQQVHPAATDVASETTDPAVASTGAKADADVRIRPLAPSDA